jgi:hypothetical protein
MSLMALKEMPREDLLLVSLRSFYDDATHAGTLLDVLQQRRNYPSLRILDWLITNYSRTRNVFHSATDAKGNRRQMSISTNYRLQLRAYSKRRFDPFCRRERIIFPIVDPRADASAPVSRITPGDQREISMPEEARLKDVGAGATVHDLVTTVGQLNFFRWAIANDIINFAMTHRDAIEGDMVQSAKEKDQHARTRIASDEHKEAPAGGSVARVMNRTITMSFR